MGPKTAAAPERAEKKPRPKIDVRVHEKAIWTIREFAALTPYSDGWIRQNIRWHDAAHGVVRIAGVDIPINRDNPDREMVVFARHFQRAVDDAYWSGTLGLE